MVGTRTISAPNTFSCHRVKNQGSRSGPDLTRIGLLRSPEQLATALLEPDLEVQPNNRTYTLVTRDGEHVRGRLLNHDAYSVQLLDDREQLRSFMKSTLRSQGFIPSPMPSVRQSMSDQELADLVKFLASLRGSSPP